MTIVSITIREATLDDLESLVQLYIDTASPAWTNLSREKLTRGVQALMASRVKGFQIVAEAHGRIVGTLRIAPEWSPYRECTFWWIENVYVVPEWRRQGVYRTMHQFLYETAKADETVCGIRLYTEEYNEAARKTYWNVGMRGRRTEQFEIDFVFGPESRS